MKGNDHEFSGGTVMMLEPLVNEFGRYRVIEYNKNPTKERDMEDELDREALAEPELKGVVICSKK